MNIVFEKVSFENFLSFKSATIELQNNGYVVVSGVNRYAIDGAKSNGAGKSTIWDAITWCLTGETIRGVKDVVNNMFKEDGCYVELFFTVNDKHFHLIRSKEHTLYKTNLKIYINSEDKSGKGIRDSEKLLSDYLPDLTASFIGSVIILGQGLPERFTNNTPAGRKDILEKLSKSDFMINDIKQSITTRQIALQRELRQAQDDSLTYTSKLQLLTAQQATLQDKLNNIGNCDELRQQLMQCETDIDLIYEQVKDVSSSKTFLTEAIRSAQSRYSQLMQEISESLQQLSDEFAQEKQQLVEKRSELQSRKSSISAEISKLRSITDICPTCGQKLPGVIKPDTSTLETELSQVSVELTQIIEKQQQLENSYAESKKQITSQFEEKKTAAIERGQSLDKELRGTETSFVTLTGQQTELTNKKYMLESKIDNFHKILQELTASVEANKKQIAELSEKILYNKTIEENISAHLDAVSKMNTIATRDFRGFLLSNIISFIDSQAKSYCKDIFGTDMIAVVLDGNNIEIGYDNKSYSALSGGERQKVDIVIQLSIRDMLSRFMGYSCNILVLDEVFDNLDSTGCEQLLQLFVRRLSDLSSIYIISHHADSLNIPYDKEIIVVKNEQGYSEIQ